MSLPQLPFKSDGTQKSFWERPEGVTGMITIGGMAIGAFVFLKLFGDLIVGGLNTAIDIVGKTITLGVLAGVLIAIYMIATSPKVHQLVSYGFKLTMRKITGAMIEIDPIGIMRIYISELQAKLGKMDDRIAELAGQVRKIREVIKNNMAKINHATAMAASANEKGATAVFRLNARKAGRAEASNLRYEDLLKKMEFLLTALRKYREAADVVIQDMTDEVDVRETERKAMLSAYGAMKSAKAILAGSSADKELYDQAMEYVVNDFGMKIGEIENFMETSQTFIQTLDIENGAFDQAALERIEAWEKKADSLLLGSNLSAPQVPSPAPHLVSQPVQASAYSHLLRK